MLSKDDLDSQSKEVSEWLQQSANLITKIRETGGDGNDLEEKGEKGETGERGVGRQARRSSSKKAAHRDTFFDAATHKPAASTDPEAHLAVAKRNHDLAKERRVSEPGSPEGEAPGRPLRAPWETRSESEASVTSNKSSDSLSRPNLRPGDDAFSPNGT